jgi:hypothetical protein
VTLNSVKAIGGKGHIADFQNVFKNETSE